MVDGEGKGLPQKTTNSDSRALSESAQRNELVAAISQLSPEQQAEVRKKLVDEQIRLAVKKQEAHIDIDIFDSKAQKAIEIAQSLSRNPSVGFRVEATQETPGGNTRVSVGRGCMSVILLVIIVIALSFYALQ